MSNVKLVFLKDDGYIDYPEDLPNFIRSHRESAGLTRAEVAEATGVSRQAVSAWENGLSSPTLDRLSKLVKHYDDLGILELEDRT